MRKILVDTNVVLDLLAKRKPFYVQSLQIFSLADTNLVEVVLSTLSLVNAHYILNDAMKIKEARLIIGKFKVLVSPYELNDKIMELALNDSNFKDFEDGIQYYTALESQCELIITKNLKDFRKSAIPVLALKNTYPKLKRRDNLRRDETACYCIATTLVIAVTCNSI